MLKEGINIDTVMKVTALSEEEIKKLEQNN